MTLPLGTVNRGDRPARARRGAQVERRRTGSGSGRRRDVLTRHLTYLRTRNLAPGYVDQRAPRCSTSPRKPDVPHPGIQRQQGRAEGAEVLGISQAVAFHSHG